MRKHINLHCRYVSIVKFLVLVDNKHAGLSRVSIADYCDPYRITGHFNLFYNSELISCLELKQKHPFCCRKINFLNSSNQNKSVVVLKSIKVSELQMNLGMSVSGVVLIKL